MDDLGERRAHARAAAEPVDALLPSVYGELRELASAVLQRSRAIDSTCTTSLVHDAYVRLTGRGMRFNDRAHFLRIAAKAMRYLLIDRARHRTALKRDGRLAAQGLEDSIAAAAGGAELLAIDEALDKLAQIDERKARIIELRFFGGLEIEGTAEALGISPATVKREWTLARAWLSREIGETGARMS